jgi:radical SAM protein with 4Fe4S-binding SPASM domain
MPPNYTSSTPLPEYALWKRLEEKRIPFSFELEVTARCNNACRHCYINRPADDPRALAGELSLDEISALADQAVELGSLWCLITGGEPLLRRDFHDVYGTLKKKGLLISVFTNACLVTDREVRLFQAYPPRDLEVTVYGVTPETYEGVTRRPGSFSAFRRGLDLLLEGGLKVRLKAMALRSNVRELPAIAAFCRAYTTDYFRFDPLLHLRYDQDPVRNEEIKAERLTPAEIAAAEQDDEVRAGALRKECAGLEARAGEGSPDDYLFHCGAGLHSFTIGHDGVFRLCSSLWHPECTRDLRRGRLKEAWLDLVPRVRALTSRAPEFLDHCRPCTLHDLCLWCPAHAHLETGRLDGWVEGFCEVARARWGNVGVVRE